MKRLLWLLILTFSLSSCGIFRSAKQLNLRHFIASELAQIESELRLSDPSFLPQRTLYLTDQGGKHSDRLRYLQELSEAGSEESIRIALLLGDAHQLFKLTKDSTILANAWLLLGNWVEAKRMLNLQESPDIGTLGMVYLAEGDTLKAIETLSEILQEPKLEQGIRAARAILQLEPTHRPSLQYLARYALSSWERFLAQSFLDDLNGKSLVSTSQMPREHALIAYLSARKSMESSQLKEATHLILEQPDTRLRAMILTDLRTRLVEAFLLPEALLAHRALPAEQQSLSPYHLLTEYAYQIEILRAFEAPEVSSATHQVSTSSNVVEGGFRAVWGNVANVDNWVMECNTRRSGDGEAGFVARPSRELYEQVRKELVEIFEALE